MSRYLRAIFSSRVLTVFFALVLVQGLHELEHIVQVFQRYALHIPNGNGLVGSLADIEPVHFVYNTAYLGLLVAVYALLGLHREAPSEDGRRVSGLLAFALVFQVWHELEHVFKLAQYATLGGVNGTGGIFGQGPGGLSPIFPVPLLHLAYNTAVYVPAVMAFVALIRQGTTLAREAAARSALTTASLRR